jgi:polysaccharide export outer membrane protein
MTAYWGCARRPLQAALKAIVVAALPLALAACNAMPNNGPLAGDIVSASDNKGKTFRHKQKYPFDVVDMDTNVASIVSAYRSPAFNKTFGLGKGGANPTIGVGDVLHITIFEAGPDGLFSTKDNKATPVIVTVQPDGRAPVPYIGSVQFAGRTLEAARGGIVEALKTRAVEPDVLVTLAENGSRTIAVNGVVGRPSVVPMGLTSERVTEVIAKAGGPVKAPYDTTVTLTRSGKTGKAQLSTLIEQPSENVYARPGDQLFLTYEPQTFTVLGSTGVSAQMPIEASSISVVEAIARAGGPNAALANPAGVFIFRYEYGAVLKSVLGDQRFHELYSKGMHANAQDLYPIVYRIDMLKPDAYLVGQTFPIRNKDVVYMARHPTADLLRFLAVVGGTAGQAAGVARSVQLIQSN